MPALTPNPDDFRIGSNSSQLVQDTFADELVRFDAIYRTSSGMELASSDDETTANAIGIVAVDGDENGIGAYLSNGSYVESVSPLWEQGRVYAVSSTPGKMIPVDELTGFEFLTILGYAESRTRFQVNIVATGVSILAAPVNTVAPAVTGIAQTDETLTCSTGTWTGSPTITYTYQWQNDDGGGFANIVGATSSTFVPADYEGDDIRCVVTATNEAGSASANSNEVGPVLP